MVEKKLTVLNEESGDIEICKDKKSISVWIEKKEILNLFDFSIIIYMIVFLHLIINFP